jgi:hypothetical protein
MPFNGEGTKQLYSSVRAVNDSEVIEEPEPLEDRCDLVPATHGGVFTIWYERICGRNLD